MLMNVNLVQITVVMAMIVLTSRDRLDVRPNSVLQDIDLTLGQASVKGLTVGGDFGLTPGECVKVSTYSIFQAVGPQN